mgnify:FL=1
MAKQQTQITEAVLLLCERIDIAQFLHVYIKHLFKQGVPMNHVQIINFENMEKLPRILKHLENMDGFDQVQKALIVADSEDNIRSKSHKIGSIIRHSHFVNLEYCQYYFFPGKRSARGWHHGYLEDVLLEVLRQDSSEECGHYNLYNITADFLLSVNGCRGREFRLKNESRHLLCGYLAGTDKYAGMRIAEAAHYDAFDLDSKKFDSLKQYLLKL